MLPNTSLFTSIIPLSKTHFTGVLILSRFYLYCIALEGLYTVSNECVKRLFVYTGRNAGSGIAVLTYAGLCLYQASE